MDIEAYMAKARGLESGQNDAATNPSGASGRYQFMKTTWEDLRRRFPDLGLKPFDQGWSDVREQDKAMAKLTGLNLDTLRTKYGIEDPQPADAYAAHLLGASGGGRFLTAVQRDPDAPVTRYVAPAAAAANRGVFYAGDKPRTVRQAYDHIARSIAAGRWAA